MQASRLPHSSPAFSLSPAIVPWDVGAVPRSCGGSTSPDAFRARRRSRVRTTLAMAALMSGWNLAIVGLLALLSTLA